MFPFTKKKAPVPACEAPPCDPAQERVRRRLDETSDRLGEAVRKMQERLSQRACAKAPLCPNYVPVKGSR